MEFMNVTFSDEEMESLSHMFSNVEELESNHSMPHCVGLSYGPSSSFLPFIAPFVDESLFYSPSTYHCHSNNFSQDFLPMQSYDQNCFFSANTNHNQYLKAMDYYSMTYPNGHNTLLEPVFCNVDDMHETSGSIEKVQEPKIDEVKESCPHDSPLPKKKSNISNKENAKKRKENTMISRNKKRKMINSSEYNSSEKDDHSNVSRELNGKANSESKDDPTHATATTSKIKTRASRGAATDPQSLYARKRREKINERLRILQNIVPNGTKVDISTMLEEAVHYVKFLQLQIKLLSSDELWMFAPIAYNGMDIGLYQRLAPTLHFSAQN